MEVYFYLLINNPNCGIITNEDIKKECEKMLKRKIHPVIYFIILILYFEILSKHIFCQHLFNIGLLYMLIFSIPIVILFTLLTKSFSNVINKIILFILTIISTIYFEVQFIFYRLFSIPFSFSTIGLADQALDFFNIIKEAILDNLFPFILFLLPLILLIIFSRRIDTTHYKKECTISLIIMFIIAYLSTFLSLLPFKNQSNSAYKLYNNVDDPISIIDTFGILTYTKIDIKRQIVGYETELIIDSTIDEVIVKPENVEYGFNNIAVDFSSLDAPNDEIKSINNYINNKAPTNKSEYTGMFKDKNLIFILAEGFNEIAVSEELTPTLYKLTNNGFVFNNFYSPVFLSTTGGEFQATTGLIPTQEILKIWKGETPEISYGLGNVFSKIGYNAQSYHNWTYSYYKRNITMNTLGFNNYLGCGNGLEERMNCTWLPSDVDLINVTTPDYLGKEEPFVTYYVTVSGHSPYNINDNIARKYWDYVKDLNYSEPVKYYIAAQMELDRMLEQLIKNLEDSGELDDTVIALVGDHYPYTLQTEEVNEAASYTKDGVVEINHSNFILWNNKIEEPIIVDKVGSQIDVLPTILNLFGIEYDSRMIVGKDILSDASGLAIFSNRSWVTDYGTYFSSSRTFVPKNGVVLEDEAEYVKKINNLVSNSFSISKMLLANNYYKYILK